MLTGMVSALLIAASVALIAMAAGIKLAQRAADRAVRERRVIELTKEHFDV